MKTQFLLDKALTGFRERDAAGASKWFDYPFFALSNETTLMVNCAADMQAALGCLIESTQPLGLVDLEKILISEETVGPGLILANCQTRLVSDDQQRFTDTRTEYIVVRNTENGPRFAASLNLFGGHIDLSALGTPVSSASSAASPAALVDMYADAIRSTDMAALGKTLEFPATAISGQQTRITPDFDQYLAYATQLADLSRKSGMSLSRVETGAPRAVGSDLVLAPITLHMTHEQHGPLQPFAQLLCLRIGMDSVSCAVVINALGDTLAKLSLRPIN